MIFHYYLGLSESQHYHIEADNFKQFRERFNLKWESHSYSSFRKSDRWYKQPVPKGYPAGALRFLIKPLHIRRRSYLLVIPEKPDKRKAR